MSTDYFQHKAASYEAVGERVDNVARIATAIQNQVQLEPHMELMDFGSGTGLLLEKLAPLVRKITAVDVSDAMNAELAKKRDALPCELEILALDLGRHTLERQFDGVISSMTLHHIDDVPAMLARLRGLIKTGGFLAIADLDSEDGSFHSEDTGVFHLGFDREQLSQQAAAAGFSQVRIEDASVAHKPQGDYPVFLLSAQA